jgi:hypothetical protein
MPSIAGWGDSRGSAPRLGCNDRTLRLPPTAADWRLPYFTFAIILDRQRRPPPGNQSIADLPLKGGAERCWNQLPAGARTFSAFAPPNDSAL